MSLNDQWPLRLAEGYPCTERVPNTLWDVTARFDVLGGKPHPSDRLCGSMFRTTDGQYGIRNLTGDVIVGPSDHCTHRQAALMLAHSREWTPAHVPAPATPDAPPPLSPLPPWPLEGRAPRPVPDPAPQRPAGGGPMVTAPAIAPELTEFAHRTIHEAGLRILKYTAGHRVPRSRSWPKRPVPIKTNARRNRRRRNH